MRTPLTGMPPDADPFANKFGRLNPAAGLASASQSNPLKISKSIWDWECG